MIKKITRQVLAVTCCLSSPLLAGTSSVDFITCQDEYGNKTVNLELETDLDETVAISVMGKISLGGIDVENFQSPVDSAELVPAGGGGYRFGVGKGTYFVAWPEEHGATLQLEIDGKEFFYTRCELNQTEVSELVKVPARS